MRTIKIILLFLWGILLSACTNITIVTNGVVDSHWTLGFPIVTIDTHNQSAIIKTKSFGVVKTAQNFNLGYLNEVYYLPDDNCYLVLFEPDISNVEYLQHLFKPDQPICTSKGN